MADNIVVFEAGAGPIIATTDRAGEHAQHVRPDVSHTGQTELLGTGGPKVLEAVSAGMTLATPQYVAGDVMGVEMEFAGAARAPGRGCEIKSAILFDDAKIFSQTAVVTAHLYLFDSPSTPAADNAQQSWTDADIHRLVAYIPFWAATGVDPFTPFHPSNQVIHPSALALARFPIPVSPVATSLYGVLVAWNPPGTFAPAQGALRIRLGVVQD